MATLLSAIISSARQHLVEATASSWTDQELADHANKGMKDLWRRINDLYKHYFVTFDSTNVTLAANSSQLTGIPADAYRVVSIEPRVVGQLNPNPGLIFKPKDYNDPEFVAARARGPVEPRNNVIYYDVMTTGAPVAAPVVRIAPQVSGAVDLLFVYNHVLATVATNQNNPIPGEADNAIMAWIIAYARAKEKDDRAPDAEWLAIYGTEKNNLMAQLTPRQIQEAQTAVGMFGEDDDWGWGQ